MYGMATSKLLRDKNYSWVAMPYKEMKEEVKRSRLVWDSFHNKIQFKRNLLSPRLVALERLHAYCRLVDAQLISCFFIIYV